MMRNRRIPESMAFRTAAIAAVEQATTKIDFRAKDRS
jgi:hypothetical protein